MTSTKKVKLSENSETVAKARFFLDENEDWEKCSRRIADSISEIEKDKQHWSEKFGDMIYNMDFLPAGRIIRNSGRPKGSLLNCYHLHCGDSIEEIGTMIRDALILWANGGGCGVNLSPLRPKGDPILGKGGHSSGLVSFLKSMDHVSETIESGGQRRAAGLASLEVSHPEILDFIDAKVVHGEISHFNISVMINDEFLEAVERDENWDLKFKQQTYKSVKARDLWDKIIENMIKHAEPGLLNTTNFFKNNSYYFAPVTGCNPCHPGDTMVAVADGRILVPFKELAEKGDDVPVYSKNDITGRIEVKMMRNPRKSGEKNKIFKIYLDNGTFFRANDVHKITMLNGEEKQIKDLVIGDRIHHMVKNHLNFMTNGFQIGKAEHRIIGEFLVNRLLEKDEVVHHKDYNHKNNSPENLQVMKKKDHDNFHKQDKIGIKNPMHRFPEKNYFKTHKFEGIENGNSYGYTREQIKEFTKEFVLSKGRQITNNEWVDFCKEHGYPYYSSYIWGKNCKHIGGFLNEIFDELPQILKLSNYHQKNIYKKFLEIKDTTDLDVFYDNGIFVRKKCEICNEEFVTRWNNREQSFCSRTCANSYLKTKIDSHPENTDRLLNFKVVKIEEDGFEDVYNGTVDDNHNYYVFTGQDFGRNNKPRMNFINSRNCGEATLSPNSSCCLGSLVLPNFITGNINTNWQKLEKVIKSAVRFLDNVLDVNIYSLRKIGEKSHDERRIGLGVMGLAEYLFAKKVRYGSQESILEVEKLMRFIRDISYKTSIELAIEKGSFPKFDSIMYGKSSFVRKLPAELRMDIKNNGIRNVTILSIAPTGTISLLPECTGGVEPLTFKSYKRKDRISERIYIHPKYKELLLAGEEIPDWFVDSTDLTPPDHFKIQASVQKYVDGSVSKTVNCPYGTTKEQLSNYLLEYIHDLKGTTVYVDGSREGQVYNKLSKEEAFDYVVKNTVGFSNSLSEEDVECNCSKKEDEPELCEIPQKEDR